MLPLRELLILAGVGQLILTAASFAIPKAMNWSGELAGVKLLIRQMFWNYAAYILVTNCCFGLLSTFAPDLLLDASPLAAAVSGYIAVYWIARVAVQFLWFDRSDMPPGLHVKLAALALELLFIYLSVVYALVFAHNVGWAA
ncbi:MAG: hypothetical protein AB7S36_08250 [Planctomycetota bacterium]